MNVTRERLLRRTRFLLLLFITGLILSGLTAFPIETEVRWLAHLLNPTDLPASRLDGLAAWITRVRDGVVGTNARYPFMAYGTDWLAFGHLVIAIAFYGPLKDPVRNSWVITFGLLACAAVLPTALIAGPIRGIPFYWQLIDCSFGVVGAVLLLPCWLFARRMERSTGVSDETKESSSKVMEGS